MTMKLTLILLITAAALTSCTSDEVNAFGRTASAAANEYYRTPGYYPPPQPVAPVAYPVIY